MIQLIQTCTLTFPIRINQIMGCNSSLFDGSSSLQSCSTANYTQLNLFIILYTCHLHMRQAARSPQQPLQTLPKNLQTHQIRQKHNRPSKGKQIVTNLKKQPPQKKSQQMQQQCFADLFSSARRAIDRGKPPPSNGNSKRSKMGSSGNKFQESTASREFKLRTQKYADPNGEYFGSKISLKYRKKSRSKKKEPDNQSLKLTRSLQKKVISLRKMERMHSSESESLRSDMSDKEMRRLQKIHSLERMQLMEDIIGIEEKLIRKKRHLL